MNIEKTGKFIADLRKEKQLTQQQLADMIGVSDKAVSRWETGRGLPDVDIWEDLAQALDSSVAELLKGERLAQQISREEVNDMAAGGLSEIRKIMRTRKYQNLLSGFLLSLVVLILLIVHLNSPIHIVGKSNLPAKIEQLDDGKIVALLSDEVAGCKVDRLNDGLVFISCYRTLWHQLINQKHEQIVMLGDRTDIKQVYYYPGEKDDQLLYTAVSDKWPDGGVQTLPRLVYNYYIVGGAAISLIMLTLWLANRKKAIGQKLLKIALVPVCFTVSVLLITAGKQAIYDAPYYLSGVILLTLVLYGLASNLGLGRKKKEE